MCPEQSPPVSLSLITLSSGSEVKCPLWRPKWERNPKEGRLPQVAPIVWNLLANAGDAGFIPGLGRSPGIGNGTPLQYSCLENSMDREPGGLQSMGQQKIGHN